MGNTNPGGDTSTDSKHDARVLLRFWIKQLHKWEKEPDTVLGADGQQVDNTAANEAKITSLTAKINDLLDERGGLADFALKLGYDYVNPSGPGYNDGDTLGNVPGGDEEEEKKKNKNKNNNDGDGTPTRGGPSLSRDLPPGYDLIRGKDGKVYAVWNAKYGPKGNRKNFPALWLIPEDKLDSYNIKKSDIKNVSQDQWLRLKRNRFGDVSEVDFKGKHPIRAFMDEMAQRYGVAPGLLRNKEVMETLFQGWMEEKDASWYTQMLKQTKWWNAKTEQRRAWVLDYSDADRKNTTKTVLESAKQFAMDQFGAVDWTKHIKMSDLEAWVQNVASGKIGWDSSRLQDQITNQARGIEGTSAFVDWEQQTPGTEQDINSTFEQVREAAINWLGYFAQPGQAELRSWADRIAKGGKTIDDFNQAMRKRKQDLYPWLSPDEGYLERASSYKNVAERLFGTSLSWEDKALMDFTGRDENGGTTGTPMTLDEYDRHLRKNDPRFWQGPEAREQGFGLVSNLIKRFTGGS